MYDTEDIKGAVRERYAGIAGQAVETDQACCGSSCCETAATDAGAAGDLAGYSEAQLAGVPEGADLGLGCGNPHAMLDLREGETVLDLGSGGGVDCFIAAKRVGPTGRVIGVDMTAEMIARARRNAAGSGYENVEFRLGEIEHLPVADASVDAIISNCVINLVPDKSQAFGEAYRVMRPGGRLSVSDIVLLAPLPEGIAKSVDAYVQCMSGAVLRDEYLSMIRDAGFDDVRVTGEQSFSADEVISQEELNKLAASAGMDIDEARNAAKLFQSVRVNAVKPV